MLGDCPAAICNWSGRVRATGAINRRKATVKKGKKCPLKGVATKGTIPRFVDHLKVTEDY